MQAERVALVMFTEGPVIPNIPPPPSTAFFMGIIILDSLNGKFHGTTRGTILEYLAATYMETCHSAQQNSTVTRQTHADFRKSVYEITTEHRS